MRGPRPRPDGMGVAADAVSGARPMRARCGELVGTRACRTGEVSLFGVL